MERKEIRAKARELLGNDMFQRKWLLAGLFLLMVGGILGTVCAAAYTAPIALVAAGPVAYSTSRIYINVVREKENEVNFKRVFDGFKENIGINIAAGVLCEVFVFLWSLLLIVPGICRAYSYSMYAYILQDNNTLGPKEALDKSRELMMGHRWELFKLDLSFIGWALLSILTCGIGFFWLSPYVETSHALFYQEIIKKPIVVDAK